MKIWGDVPKIPGIYKKQGEIKKINNISAVASKKDVVSISNQARDYQTATRALKDVPDIRKEKVDALAARIESGGYDVSGRDVAEKLFKSIFDKRV